MTSMFRILLMGSLLFCTACKPGSTEKPTPAETGDQVNIQKQIDTYATVVYENYVAAHRDAVELHAKIKVFLDDPKGSTLTDAKKAWLVSRDSYGQTEAFRFYEGPIDFADEDAGTEGPEGQLNAWPLNEAWIDYVKDSPQAGIIHETDVAITREALVDRNGVDDEANVTTGYHAIEFLLWGQDFNDNGPGTRPASDFAPGDPNRQRRRDYLLVVTELLVEDLQGLVSAWEPDQKNYRAEFVSQDPNEAIGKILTGLATLAGFEMASERIAAGLDSGDQEDEHSCFSDNTHNDFRRNMEGILNVYYGRFGEYQGQGLNKLVAKKAPELSAKIEAQLEKARKQIEDFDVPVDATLRSAAGSSSRAKMEAAVTSLQELAESLRDLSEPLDTQVIIAGE